MTGVENRVTRVGARAASGVFGVCLLAASAVIAPGTSLAETIKEALATAYMNNPTLRAERARQRGTDEQVSQALSGWRPTIIAEGDAGYTAAETTPGANTETDPRGVGLSLRQPIFRGFRTVNSTESAEASVAAGQQTLLSVEQTVLLDGATAYMNVIRDLRILRLREENVGILGEQVRGTDARFEVGELTRTDVAQANARLSQARSDLADARANLASSRALYRRVVGNAPASLGYPETIAPLLPSSLEEAIEIAEQVNPTVLAARFTEESSLHEVDVAIGELLPSVDFTATYDRREDPSSFVRESDTLSVTGTLSVPLYQSGAEHSRVREAKQLNSQRRLEVLEAMRLVREEVVVSWNLLISARESIRSDRDQVDANNLAFQGIQQEALVGSRTILDVLDTNRDLIESRILLEASRRDEVVASYRLLAAVGRLTAQNLGLPVPIYDPTENLERVRNQLFGLEIGPEE